MASLFKLLLVNTGPNKAQHGDAQSVGATIQHLRDSQEETQAAREFKFLPLCEVDEALELSAANQPVSHKKSADRGRRGLLAHVLRGLGRAFEFVPCRIARGVLASLSPDVQLRLMAGISRLDRTLLSMKLLAEGPQWRPGTTNAARMLYMSPIDKAFCQWLRETPAKEHQ